MDENLPIIPITDDYMFCHVFEEKEKCKELLERVLGISIAEISSPVYQRELSSGITNHGIRLDVYVRDTDGNAYDIEMQTTKYAHLGKRIRYYHSEIDRDMIRQGQDYRLLANNIVIFFCNYGDPFDKNKSVYMFKSLCVNDPSVELNDEVLSVVLWPGGSYDGVDDKLVNVLEYIKTGKANDDFTMSIDNKTIEYSNDVGWRNGYMTIEQKIREESDMAYNKGIEDSILGLVSEGLLDARKAADRLGISLEDFTIQIEKSGNVISEKNKH